MPTMSASRGRLHVALALALTVLAFDSAPTLADNGPYTFTVDVDGGVPTATPGALGVYAGDADAAANLTIENTSDAQTLGSADVTVPAPFVVLAIDAVPYAGGAVLPLRDLALAPGASRTFALTLDVQTCVATPAASFDVAAKESGDFSGTGNDLSLVEASSDRLLDIVGTCGLAFVGQPTSAERTKTITTVPFAPAGPAISVELRDAGDTGRATSSSAAVTLTAARPGVPLASGLGGTVSVAAAAGLATFAPGPTLGMSAYGYTLTAASTGVTSSSASSAFDIVDSRAGCATGSGCTASSDKNGTAITAELAGGAGAGDLLLSLDAVDRPPFECADYPWTGSVVSEFRFSGGNDRIVTFTAVIPGGQRPLKDNQVCWAAPYPFMTAKRTTATIQGVKPGTSDPLYVGVLPFCQTPRPQIPCVVKRTMDPNTKAITISVLSDSRDPWRYN